MRLLPLLLALVFATPADAVEYVCEVKILSICTQEKCDRLVAGETESFKREVLRIDVRNGSIETCYWRSGKNGCFLKGMVFDTSIGGQIVGDAHRIDITTFYLNINSREFAYAHLWPHRSTTKLGSCMPAT